MDPEKGALQNNPDDDGEVVAAEDCCCGVLTKFGLGLARLSHLKGLEKCIIVKVQCTADCFASFLSMIFCFFYELAYLFL